LCEEEAAREDDAATAVERWQELERARTVHRGDGEQRFRRRAFERARDRALIALALRRGRASRRRGRPRSFAA